jgi:hypothetical protein
VPGGVADRFADPLGDAVRRVAGGGAAREPDAGTADPGEQPVAHPAPDATRPGAAIDPAAQLPGQLVGAVHVTDQGIEREAIRTHHGSDNRTGGCAHDDVGVGRVPLGGHAQGDEGPEMKGGAGDAAAAEHEADSRHPIDDRWGGRRS